MHMYVTSWLEPWYQAMVGSRFILHASTLVIPLVTVPLLLQLQRLLARMSISELSAGSCV